MFFFKRFSTFQVLALVVGFSLTFIYLYITSNNKYHTDLKFNGLLTKIYSEKVGVTEENLSKHKDVATSLNVETSTSIIKEAITTKYPIEIPATDLTKHTELAASTNSSNSGKKIPITAKAIKENPTTAKVAKENPTTTTTTTTKTTTTTTTKKTTSTTTTTTTTTKSPVHHDRLGVISYIPNSVSHVHQFILFLHGSWRYMIEHQKTILEKKKPQNVNAVDLLSFCHPNICKELKHVCVHVKDIKEINEYSSEQNCFAIEQPFEIDIPYAPLNSYIMFNRSDITGLSPRYKYLLRTDNDVFITPALFLLKPKRFLFGQGGYSTAFNNNRLKQIAKRLGLVHRGVNTIGSTWCGQTELLTKAGKMAIKVSRYIFLNEFDKTNPEISRFFKNNPEGEWPDWWRPVSSMYGGDLTLNHLIPDISSKNRYSLDASSCDTKSIWESPHIHCWHNDCKFSKFRFQGYLNTILSGKGTLAGDIIHELVENTYTRDVREMTLQQYSTFIAWNSIGKHLRKWVL